MVDSRSTVDSENKSNLENEDSEDESEILEESPCGRWLKRREEVEQRDIPGIDATYLAMDTEEGVEVVWNEVRFSERKYFNAREEKISEVFDRLNQLKHPNIVKLHKHWMDKDVDNPRVIFITEYMSSGSLKQFLKKTKRNVIKMALPVSVEKGPELLTTRCAFSLSSQAWKRWCTQILSALCYLHSSQPPIIHANLTCDTIFISHNGLIKIGAVAPDAIHRYVKTVKEDSMANIYYVAPEIGSVTGSDSSVLGSAVDIYSFGMCALEMAALEITGNGETGTQITDETVNKTIESLDNPLQKDFIRKCLQKTPVLRPTARELLFHPVIYEVPSLRLLSAHVIVNTPSYQPEQLTEEALYRSIQSLNADTILAQIFHKDGRPGTMIKCCDAPRREMEKFLDEVRNGAYPLTAIMPTSRPPIISRQRTTSPTLSGEALKQSTSPDNPYDEENRRIINMMCNVKAHQESELLMVMTLLLRMDDKMNRQLSCDLENNESPMCIADELVYCGFINQADRDMVATLITDTINRSKNPGNFVQTNSVQ